MLLPVFLAKRGEKGEEEGEKKRREGKEEKGRERGRSGADGREREREKRWPAADFAGAATGRLTSSERRRGEKERGKSRRERKYGGGEREKDGKGGGWKGVATEGRCHLWMMASPAGKRKKEERRWREREREWRLPRRGGEEWVRILGFGVFWC